MKTPEEGDKCPSGECHGILEYIRQGDCSCHISPPCSACTEAPLTCPVCFWMHDPEPEPTINYTPPIPAFTYQRPSTDLGNGKRIFDYDYDSSSGSTMEYEGRYEGDVTAEDIIKHFGDGSWGHRGPFIGNGRFKYTKVTD